MGTFWRLTSNQAAQDRPKGPSARSNGYSVGNPFGANPLFCCKEPWDGTTRPDPVLSFHPEPGSPWEKVALILKERLGDAIFRSWVTKLTFGYVKDNTVIFKVENSFLRDTLKERYTYHILKAWQSVEDWIQDVDVRVACSY